MGWLQTASLVASIATIVAGVAVVITAGIYFLQLQAMTKARELESLIVIMRYVDSLELRKARHLMQEHATDLRSLFETPFSATARKLIDSRIRELSAGELTIEDIDLALHALNNVCYLIRYGYAPPEAAQGFMKNTLLHAWIAFEPYIRYRRGRPDTIGEPSRYAEHFEWVLVDRYKREAVGEVAH